MCAAACRMRRLMMCCAGEALTRAPHQQAGSGAAAASGARSEADCVPALRVPPGMRLIDPAELTLGALIGEGGFGKARIPPHSLMHMQSRSCLTGLQIAGVISCCMQWSSRWLLSGKPMQLCSQRAGLAGGNLGSAQLLGPHSDGFSVSA